MVGRRGRPPKRKVEEEHEEQHGGKSKMPKEAKIESISLDASEPLHMGLITLGPSVWEHQKSCEEWSEEHNAPISEAELGDNGMVSQGTFWRGDLDQLSSQVVLSCRREANGEAFDCETQTLHFSPVNAPTVVVVPETDTPESIKVEIDPEQEFLSHPLICSVRNCGSHSDTHDAPIFYTVPETDERMHWDEMLDIIPLVDAYSRQHVCSKHFLTPTKLTTPKGKTRKKKTCDMLVAEEAEKIKQGLSSGRPKRTPKPNKNYDWAEIGPLIKAESDDLEEEVAFMHPSSTVERSGSSITSHRRQVLSSHKEDKENKRPNSDTEGESGREEDGQEKEKEDEEEEEDLENISLPSHPRPPPPKPKGRPHRIRDSGTQTEGVYSPTKSRLPLREVKVQCSLTSEPQSPCTNCSYINWVRLEELLVECITKTAGDLCVPLVQECLKRVVNNAPHTTHAINVLRLLSGEKKDVVENSSDIVLVPSQEDEVEIENIIHPAVDEPITGLREITPKTWQKKVKLKKNFVEVEVVLKEPEEEEEEDGLGLQEATEMDDEEFHPGYLEGEESEEEEDQGLDDEDWTISKQDRDTRPSARKKQRKGQQQIKVKKEQTVAAGEGAGADEDGSSKGEESPTLPRMPHSSLGRRRRLEGDTRWIRKPHSCSDCGMVFSTQRKFDQHFNHMHLGIAPWQGEHTCDDCGKVFTQKISLNVHRMFKHGAPRRYQCNKCVYEAPTKEYLKRHMKVHTNERRFVCPHCCKGLKTAESFRNHMVIHTNKGRFVCQVCQKAYNHKGAYQDHVRTHCEDRDFACDYCGAAFKAYKHVARHIRAVHLNDKRFICDVCGAKHMTGFNLKTHIKKHGDLSSLSYAYQCKVCEAKFRGSEGLASHVRVVHATLPIQSDSDDPRESGIKADTEEEARLVTPHPTRRPVQFHYSKITRIGGNPPTSGSKDGKGDGWGIYLDNTENYYLYDGKDEAVVYEVYSSREEEELEEVMDKEIKQEILEEEQSEVQAGSIPCSVEEVGGERVIHVYPCSTCQIMFTCRSMLEQHVCHQRRQDHEQPKSSIKESVTSE